MKTFTAHDIAVAVHHRHDIDTDIAAGIVEAYLEQIEKVDGRDIDRDQVAEDDVDFVIESVDHARRAGDLGTRELEDVADNRAARDQATEERDIVIRKALAAGARISDVADAAGLSRETIRAIRGRK